MIAAAGTAQVLMRKAVWKFKRLCVSVHLVTSVVLTRMFCFLPLIRLWGSRPRVPPFSVVPLPLLREFGAKTGDTSPVQEAPFRYGSTNDNQQLVGKSLGLY
jgi:hypothetical protein